MKHIPKILKEIDLLENTIFRGHSNCEWVLKPSIGRRFSGDWKKILEIEKRNLSEFKKRAIPFIKHQPKSDLEWLCLMQHHGLATRLLDFTTNPLIAIFFATDPRVKADGELISASYQRSYENIEDAVLFDGDHEFAYFPPHITERIIGQQGCFAYSKVPNREFAGKSIRRFRISEKSKNDIRTELQALGITNSLLFPGIDGLCKDMNESLEFVMSLEYIF